MSFQCRHCGSTAPPKKKRKDSVGGIILLVALLIGGIVFWWPLLLGIWIPALMWDTYHVCRECGLRLD